MYVIIVYDVSVERVSKICGFLRQYLHWIQNSVFEGELTNAEFEKIKNNIKRIIDENSDSVIIYRFSHSYLLKKERIGVEKTNISSII